MGRPPDATKLPESEAERLRNLLRRGKEQYCLSWRDVGAEAGYSEKQVRNYVNGARPPSAQVAKVLLRGVLCASGARSWRQSNGCCPEHRTGEGVSCSRRGDDGKYSPCDPWYTLASSWWLSREWALARRPFLPALIAPAAFDALSKELARQISSHAGLGVSKRDSVARAIFSYLNRNGGDLASDAVFLFSSRIEQLINDAERGKHDGGFDDPVLDRVSLDHVDLVRFARSALTSVARLDWPDLKDRSITIPLPLDLEAVLNHKDAAFRDRLKPSSENGL